MSNLSTTTNNQSTRLPVWAIIFIIIACIGLGVGVALLIMYLHKKEKSKRHTGNIDRLKQEVANNPSSFLY